jgi:hypothetical protein
MSAPFLESGPYSKISLLIVGTRKVGHPFSRGITRHRNKQVSSFGCFRWAKHRAGKKVQPFLSHFDLQC